MHRRTLLATALAAPALGQDIPGRTIQLVMPFSTGTVIDIMARAFAEPFRQALGGNHNVVVVAREGGGGTVGASVVAAARPDGATIGFGPSGMLTTQPFLVPSLPYRLDGFEPLCQTFENIFVLAVPRAAPFTTLPELIEAARRAPETISFGHAGNGTVGHLIVRQLELMGHFRLTDVAYRTGGQMMTDALAGSIGMVATTWATLRDGALRPIAVAADARDPAIPAPTLAELGFPVTWRGFGGLWAPRGLPRPVAARIEAACAEAVNSPQYRQVMEQAAQVVAYLPAEAFAARLAAEQREASSLLASLNLIPR